jgi:hypothetical protein
MMLQILHQQLWFQHFPETLETALKVNRHAIELFRDTCRREGIELTYTVIPSKDMVEPEDLENTFTSLRQHDPKWTAGRIVAFDHRLTDATRTACAELGVHFVDLRDGILARKRGLRMYYPRDMHMNPEGNSAVGEILAAELKSASHTEVARRQP